MKIRKTKKKHSLPSPLPQILQEISIPQSHTQKKVSFVFEDRAEPGLMNLHVLYYPLQANGQSGPIDRSSMAHVIAEMCQEFMNIIGKNKTGEFPENALVDPVEEAVNELDQQANVIQKPRLVN